MRSDAGTLASPCQTIFTGKPVMASIATFTSRSQLDPGKTTTEARSITSPRELERVVLDHGVGEEILAHALNLGAHLLLVSFRDVDLDVLALTHVVDARESERAERALDCLALGVKNAIFQGDSDAGLHAPARLLLVFLA